MTEKLVISSWEERYNIVSGKRRKVVALYRQGVKKNMTADQVGFLLVEIVQKAKKLRKRIEL